MLKAFSGSNLRGRHQRLKTEINRVDFRPVLHLDIASLARQRDILLPAHPHPFGRYGPYPALEIKFLFLLPANLSEPGTGEDLEFLYSGNDGPAGVAVHRHRSSANSASSVMATRPVTLGGRSASSAQPRYRPGRAKSPSASRKIAEIVSRSFLAVSRLPLCSLVW